MITESYTVRRVPVERTLALRKAVLRPHLPAETPYLPPDATAPDTVAYAALDSRDRVIGVAVLTPHPPPFAPADSGARQLRGMAVAPAHRNRGVGGAVLDALIAHVAHDGGGILWCNARIAARGLYERGGMSAWGEVFDVPPIGPHIVMWRRGGPGGAVPGPAAGVAPRRA